MQSEWKKAMTPPIGKRVHPGLTCKVYLTKSGLRVFSFCPAGSTSKAELISVNLNAFVIHRAARHRHKHIASAELSEESRISLVHLLELDMSEIMLPSLEKVSLNEVILSFTGKSKFSMTAITGGADINSALEITPPSSTEPHFNIGSPKVDTAQQGVFVVCTRLFYSHFSSS